MRIFRCRPPYRTDRKDLAFPATAGWTTTSALPTSRRSHLCRSELHRRTTAAEIAKSPESARKLDFCKFWPLWVAYGAPAGTDGIFGRWVVRLYCSAAPRCSLPSPELGCPHLKSFADIGLAMGIQGTEVVKESSDIIILDGNLATVSKSIRWGLSMNEKVLRALQQQLTANIVALILNCLAAVYYCHIPLNAVQFVWVNVIIFCLGPLVMATESPADHLKNVPPIERGQPVMKYIQWKRLCLQVMYQIIALLVINFQGGSLLKNYTIDHATKVKNTMIFNTFVVCQISIEIGVRKTGILDHPLKWITGNSVFLGIVGIVLVLQFIIIEFLGKAFFVVRLDWKEWQFSLTVGMVELLFALLIILKHFTQRNHQ